MEVWKPEHDPRSHSGIVVPFLKRAASPVDAHAAALEAAKDSIEEEMVWPGLPPALPGEGNPMTRCGPCVVGTMFWCLLAVATVAHAESAWILWQQATVFTERWWIPKGWSSHWRATELTPVGLAEFPTLADCQVAQTQAVSRDANLVREVEAKEKSGTSVARFVSRFACVPLGWRPRKIEPEGLWK